MKKVICIILAILMILLPFVSVVGVAALAPSQYDNTFVGELSAKYNRLKTINEPKVVLIGGSSVAFGYDSELLEEYFDMPVVNFGLYAALGTKVMLDLSRDCIKKGDIVLLAPELDAQTLSLYFNSDTTLQAIDNDFSLFFELAPENWLSMLGGMWKFALNKVNYMLNGKPDPEGVYNSKNFNEYGDVEYAKEQNTMFACYDINNEIVLDKSIVSQDFVDYLNEYIDDCKKVGASVYFTYCPMNEMALADDTTEESIESFVSYLQNNIHCTFISDISDSIMDAAYFYDTNFHLNNTGVTYHTVNLIKDYYLETDNPSQVTVSLPEPPELPQLDVAFEGVDENANDFLFALNEIGAYSIVGLSDVGKTKTTLTIPLGYNHVKVMSIGKNAFLGGVVEKLIVTEDTNLGGMANGCFNGCSNLKELWMYPSHEENITPCDFVGVSSSFKVYIPFDSNYRDGYTWSQCGLTFVDMP